MSAEETARYLELVWQRPRPTDEQINAFARFLARDHSWYKKLPLSGVGEPFFLYLDPNVHAVLVRDEAGRRHWRPVVREVPEGGGLLHDWHVALQPGDIKPEIIGPMHYLFSNRATTEYREHSGTGAIGTGVHPSNHATRLLLRPLRASESVTMMVESFLCPSRCSSSGSFTSAPRYPANSGQ